jgi:serine/threonine-protein phosphatase 5
MGLMRRIRELHAPLANIVKLNPRGTFRIVGDTHGQYQDLVNIFAQFGWPSSENPYLFNGDFVDRGSQGMEILIALWAWKLAEPDGLYFNRGNHETIQMNQMYGFEGECKAKYSPPLFSTITELFNTLPLGHILADQVLIVHGGISADPNATIQEFQAVDRKGQPPESGPVNDLLWADPQDQNGTSPSPRGVTKTFGPDITEAFLKKNGLKFVIRSHQVQEQGYCVHHRGMCITVFSAPNYCGQMKNKGAVVKLTFAEDGEVGTPEFETFEAQPIPPAYPPMKYCAMFR